MCDHCGCRAFGPIAELTTEHVTILALAWRLAESTDSPPTTAGTLRRELAALLAVHVAKEETGLYPLLVDTGGLGVEALSSLEDEHSSFDEALRSGAFDRRAYFALAAHIEEEEMELFPSAMFGFDDDDWAALESTYHAVDVAASS